MNEALEGGLITDMRIEPWLGSLFQPDPLKPGSVIEHPENLVFAGGQITDAELNGLRTMYSFQHIRQAFFLHRMCIVKSGASVVRALCDNFLMNAYANWNLASNVRQDWLRTQQSIYADNTRVAEAIGALPFCAIEDPEQNELFLVSAQKEAIQVLERQKADLLLTIQQDQQLMQSAAQDKIMLTSALASAREASELALASVRQTEQERYAQLQASTDALVAEKNAEIHEQLEFMTQNANRTAKAMGDEIEQLKSALMQRTQDFERLLGEVKRSCEKDLELGARAARQELQAKEEEFKVLFAGKVQSLMQDHKNELGIRDAKVKAAEEEVAAANSAMKDLRTQFGMLSTQASLLRQNIANAEEGIKLRDREISTLRAMLDDERSKASASIVSLEHQLGSLRQQNAATVQTHETQIAALRAKLNAECEQDLAQLSRDANARHEQALEAMRAGKAAEIANVTNQYAAQIQSIRQEFQRVQSQGNEKEGCVIV